jgi:TolB-like protein/Tfp pilus assembly protein PilF
MMEEEGKEQSSTPGAQPPGPAVAGSLRPVFISYGSADAPLAQKVCAALEAAGSKCWIAPRDVVPGTLYAEGIVRALDESRVLVLILSKDAVASPHVGRELERAASKRHAIIGFKVDAAPLNRAFEYFLNQSQWIELGAVGADAAIAKLVEAVRLHLNSTATVGPSSLADSPTAGRAAQELRKRWMAAAAIAVVAGTLVWLLADKFWLSKHVAEEKPIAATVSATGPAAPAIPEKSVAVLPFVDMSEKKDQEYFSDGLSEELIDMLTKIPDLRVPARTSSFYFKGKSATIAEIAKALAVAHVLEGSVRKSGNTLRITAQLVRVDNGYHVWSETYDRKLDDIFKIQDEIAGAVVGHLKLALLKTAPGSTTNTEAYNLLLQARYFSGRGNPEDLATAVVLYDRAIAIDPNYALAYAELADCYALRVSEGVDTNGVGYTKSRAAAERAIALDPNLAEGYRALAAARLQYELNWAAAGDLLRKAQALDPNSSSVLHLTGLLTQATGSLADAEGFFRRALDNDPLNVRVHRYLGRAFFYQNKLSDAEKTIREMIELDPKFPGAHFQLGIVLLSRGDPNAALAAMEAEPSSWKPLGLPLAYWALRRTTDARAALAAAVSDSAGSEFQVAEIYGYFDKPDEALQWLERARARHDPGLIWIRRDPLLRSVVADPRYKAFLQRIHLPSD